MTATTDHTTPHPLPTGTGSLLIGGQWVPSADGGLRDLLDPATGTRIGTAAEATGDDTARAVAAARAALPAWSAVPARQRGRLLLRAADLVRERAEEFARLESLDTGKPLALARAVDVATAIEILEYYAALASGIEGSVRSTGAPWFAYTLREPVGVIAAVTPFNFPLILSMSKIAPALAAGNTVVHKPAEETPLSALLMAEVLGESGIPDGVLNVVTGGPEAGRALVTDPGVDKIAFTGSTAVGRQIARDAASVPTPVTAELGGKGANIVFADADLDAAVETAVRGFVFNTGQFCMAGSRLLVERPVHDAVVAALARAVPSIPVGDPADESTVIGPMTGPRHLAKVAGVLERAAHGGARVAVGGTAHLGTGFFVEPTVLCDVAQDSEFVQEEIFGPVLTVQAFDTEEEAVALANGTRYGLAAGLQTRDVARAHRVAARLRAGIVWINTWAGLDVAVPFGGRGASGHGREFGPEGLDAYLSTKSVVLPLG